MDALDIAHQSKGLLSDVDIRNAIRKHKLVLAPFDVNDYNDKRLTPAGFNFSFTRIIISVNARTLYKIHKKKDGELFFKIRPGDTALALTRETIWVSKELGGTFHSKVGYVSKGLGHVSTTLDPGWQGQLLIAVSNPRNRTTEVPIGKVDDNENITYYSFITLYLFWLANEAKCSHDNDQGRLNLLIDKLSNGNTKNEKKLVKMVIALKNSIQEMRTPDLNTSTNLDIDVRTFIDNHDKVLKEIDKRFSEIERVNNATNIRNHIARILTYLLVYTVLFFVLLVVYKNVDENTRWPFLAMIVAAAQPAINRLLAYI